MEKVNIDQRDLWKHSLTDEERKAGKKPKEELMSSMSTGMLLTVIMPECIRRIHEKRNSEMLFTAKLERATSILANRNIKIPTINWNLMYEEFNLKLKTIPNEEFIVEFRRRLINGEISMPEAQEHVMQYAHDKIKQQLTNKIKN